MPHTSRRNKTGNQNKRQNILDEDGWTRVTSAARSLPGVSSSTTNSSKSHRAADEVMDPRGPMLPATGSSLESMTTHFRKVNEIWLETELCKKLEDLLAETILSAVSTITNCVVFGTGSFCGDAVHWIDRHEVAYFQLAAFKTVVDTIERVQGRPVPAYAQEPHYNDLDAALLASLNVTQVDDPRGFELLDEHSFAYSPFAETTVKSLILARTPRIWLYRNFDPWLEEWSEDETAGKVNQFRDTWEHANLPHVDLKYLPFHETVIWWKKQDSLNDT